MTIHFIFYYFIYLFLDPLIHVSWYLLNNTNNRPYFVVGDHVNVTWSYNNTWYKQYNIPNVVFPTTSTRYIYRGANDPTPKNFGGLSISLNQGILFLFKIII